MIIMKKFFVMFYIEREKNLQIKINFNKQQQKKKEKTVKGNYK